MPRRRSLLLAGLGALAAAPARAAPPVETVRLLVGAAAGSGIDQRARAFAPFLERHLPRRAVRVANDPAAGGLGAALAVAAAAPDGALLGLVATPSLLARAIERGRPAVVDALDLLGTFAEEPVVLVAPPGGPVDSLASLVAEGGRAPVATPAAGSAPHLAALALAAALPLPLLAFPNAAAVRQAVLAGNVPAAMLSLPDALPALREDRLVALAVATAAPVPPLPDVPTFTELGHRLVVANHRGLVAPAGLAPRRRAALVAALEAVVADPEFATQAGEGGYLPRMLDGPAWRAALDRAGRDLRERWARAPWPAP